MNIADILILSFSYIIVKHRAADKAVLIFVLDNSEQIECSEKALGHDHNVVVHQQNMSLLFGKSHSFYHTSCKAARTADIGVGVYLQILAVVSLGVKRTFVVYYMNEQIALKVTAFAQYLRF